MSFLITETTLAQPLNNGDTIVYLTSASNWHTSASANSTRKLGVYYNEIDVYPKYTYTRSTVYYTEADLINNTITLTTPWSGGTIPAGSFVSNNYDTGTYQYISASYASVPFTWTKYINSTAVSGWGINNSYSYFRYGTEYIKLLFLSNYGQDSTYTTLVDNLKFYNTKAQNKVVNVNIEKTSNIVATDFSEVGITDGLVAYYPLNGDAKDYSGNGNHGTVYGATMATGINNKKCYSFDGIDDSILVDDNPNISFSGEQKYSLCAWVYPIAGGVTWYGVMSKGNANSYAININSPSWYLQYEIYGSLTTRAFNTANSAITPDAWNHIVVLWDGSYKRIYINGIEVKSIADSDLGTYANTEALRIGLGNNGEYLKGKIQDVRIYNRALSDKEIGILYNLFNPNINKTLQINKENIIYTKGNIKEV